ncbi:MAG: DUF4124 domain-containing protein [Psychromonas sp.]
MPCLIILLTFLFSSSVFANIYTWEDEKGIVHFSESKPAHSLPFKTIAIDLPTPEIDAPDEQDVQDDQSPSKAEQATNADSQEQNDLYKMIEQVNKEQ